MRTLPFAVTALLIAAPLSAQELLVGLGATHFNRREADDGAQIELEYHWRSWSRLGNFAFFPAAAAVADSRGDYFLGLGLGAEVPLGHSGWFLQASVMPGYYNPSDSDNDLGNDVEFRSTVALGYRFSSGWSAWLAGAHLSNAGLGDRNPGMSIASLRLGRSF